MVNPLLDDVLPAELAERSQVFEIKAEVGDFARLVEIVAKDLEAASGSKLPRKWRQAPVAIRLAFAWADIDRALPRVTGCVTASLATVCQRCLEAFELPVAADIDVLLSRENADGHGHEQAGAAETWELDDDRLRLADLVEECLVMAMPLAPMHATRVECGPLVQNMGEIEETTSRPFADLRSRMERSED